MKRTLLFLSVLFFWTVSFAQSTDSYQFDSKNQLMKILRSNSYRINYEYDEVGNRISLIVTEISPNDIGENISQLGVKLYPNPTSESFSISGFEECANIILTDISGKVVLAKQVTEYEIIPIGSLPKGVYIVEITTKMGVVKKKLLKK